MKPDLSVSMGDGTVGKRKSRKDRLVYAAESIVEALIPLNCSNIDDLYRIEVNGSSAHVLIDVFPTRSELSGQLIGKQGNTARAIRRILESIANQEGLRVTFNIINPA